MGGTYIGDAFNGNWWPQLGRTPAFTDGGPRQSKHLLRPDRRLFLPHGVRPFTPNRRVWF